MPFTSIIMEGPETCEYIHELADLDYITYKECLQLGNRSGEVSAVLGARPATLHWLGRFCQGDQSLSLDIPDFVDPNVAVVILKQGIYWGGARFLRPQLLQVGICFNWK